MDASIAAQHPADTWKALLTAMGIIGTLVSVLYYRLNKDISGQGDKLDKGQEAFVEIGKQLVILGEKIAQLQTGRTTFGADLADLEEDIKELTARLTVLETEHNNCIPRKLSMKGTLDDR